MARIDQYEFGRIVVDGREETRDLIILPGRVVRNWWRRDGHALVLDDLAEPWTSSRPTWSWGPAPPGGCAPTPRRSASSRTAA
jgi:hypothetical protein